MQDDTCSYNTTYNLYSLNQRDLWFEQSATPQVAAPFSLPTKPVSLLSCSISLAAAPPYIAACCPPPPFLHYRTCSCFVLLTYTHLTRLLTAGV